MAAPVDDAAGPPGRIYERVVLALSNPLERIAPCHSATIGDEAVYPKSVLPRASCQATRTTFEVVAGSSPLIASTLLRPHIFARYSALSARLMSVLRLSSSA